MNEIKMDVQKMVKRRKDSGFTLIELMIVIAVIGILAVVLVPKVGSIKTQAKGAGVDTNMRTVEAYIQSRISSWANVTDGNGNIIGTTRASVASDIASSLGASTDKIANPFSASTAINNDVAGSATLANDAVVLASADQTGATTTQGTVVVEIPANVKAGSPIILHAHDIPTGNELTDKRVTINP